MARFRTQIFNLAHRPLGLALALAGTLALAGCGGVDGFAQGNEVGIVLSKVFTEVLHLAEIAGETGDAVAARPPVSAPGSALRSVPTVALSSAQVRGCSTVL